MLLLRYFLLFILILTINQSVKSQCNAGLNLGTVVVPTHGDSANNGNFLNPVAWQEAASWVDSLNLNYRQKSVSWVDVVTQINSGIPAYSGYYNFENSLTTWAGNCDVHIVYPTINVALPNTVMNEPPGFISAVNPTNSAYFSDTAYVNQNYRAIKHILQNVNNVRWISVGNEIDTYFKNLYWGTGRLTRYTAFLDTIRNRMNADGFANVKLGSIVAFHNLTWSGNYDIIDSIRPHVDFIGYTFYYTTLGAPNDSCWGNPATVTSWLDIAKSETGNKEMLISETCMGDGGGASQSCGSTSKQLAYADTLLNWYNNDTLKVIGMTWFTIVDPYLGWQTPNDLWNTCGLIDSNGVTIQAAGLLWRHNCPVSVFDDVTHENYPVVYPNPSQGKFMARGKGEIAIYNLNGVSIFTKHNIGTTEIDITSQPSGIYFFVLKGENNIFTLKIVIQRPGDYTLD